MAIIVILRENFEDRANVSHDLCSKTEDSISIIILKLGSKQKSFSKVKRVWTQWEAALAIQNCWQGYRVSIIIVLFSYHRCIIVCMYFGKQDRKIFMKYRDLIAFRHRGHPAVVLRSINPAEVTPIIIL